MTSKTVILDDEQLKKAVPAAFAKRADKSRTSEKYGFIPTTELIGALRKAGFHPVQAANQRAYKGGNNDQYGRHMLRFRSTAGADAKLKRVGDCVPEVVIITSHNGRTRFIMRAGLFRLICSNGMTVATAQFGQVMMKHMPNALEKVVALADKVIKDAAAATKVVEAMMAVKMTDKSAKAFATKAMALRFRAAKKETAPITVEQVLTARRKDDEGMDFWRVFNRVQENLIKGGQEGQAASGRNVTTRQLTSIRRDAQVNFDLWQLALKGLTQAGKMPKLESALPVEALAA